MSVIYEPRGRAREYAPLAANLYSGCTHGCEYCYAPAALRRNKQAFHGAAAVRKGVLDELARDARRMAGSGARVLLSFTTDPYQPAESFCGVTRRAIEILHAHGLSIEVLTKGGTRASRDFDLYGPGDAFASTLTFLDPAQSEKWEPNAALPNDRIEAIRQAHTAGITTWVSLEPVIDPEQSLEIIRQMHPYVDLFKVGKLNYHPQAKNIDWREFGHEATSLLSRLGKRYYIKDDLREHMERPYIVKYA